MPASVRPMPVSRTAKSSSGSPLSTLLVAGTRQHDLARLGELDRVAEQVEQDLAQPRHVADDGRRHLALEHVGEVEVLLGRARADQVERRLDAVAQVERLRLDVHPPGLDLREVEDVVDDRQQRVAASRGWCRRSRAARRSAACRAAGRSCRSPRSSACGSRGSSSPGRRSWPRWRLSAGGAGLLRLLEQPRVLDRDHGLVGEGLQQRELLLVEGFGGWRTTMIEPMPWLFPDHRRPGGGKVADLRHGAHRPAATVGEVASSTSAATSAICLICRSRMTRPVVL